MTTERGNDGVNIYDIAALAGVSASTVSRVVNNKPGVKQKTRQTVQRLLEKYNYAPNENARGLVTQASRIIGILVPDIRDFYHAGSAFHIERSLTARGYCCLLFNTGPEQFERAEHLQTLRQRQVDGAVLIGSSFQTDMVKNAIVEYLSTVPIVMANGYLDLPNTYSVLMDEATGVAELVRLLWHKGRRRIAFVAASRITPGNTRKRDGFLQAMRETNAPDPLWLYQCDHSLESAYAVTNTIVNEHPDVDAIMFSWDLDAVGGMHALLDRGKKVPDDIAVTGVDNSLYAELCYPGLTSVNIGQKAMCLAAADTLLHLLEGRESPRTVRVPSGIVERRST